MRVLIATSGSTGDVAPYVGLGARLAAAGHVVTVAADPSAAAAVTGAGLAFAALPGDVRVLLPAARGHDGRGSGTDVRAQLRLLRLARPLVAELGRGLAAAARTARPQALLLSTLVAPLGYQVAEAAGVPAAGAFLQPVEPTGAFGPVLLGGRDLGRSGNRAAGAAVARTAELLYAGPVRDLRRRLGLPRVGTHTLRRRQDGAAYPVFHGFSPAVVPRPADWGPRREVVGYWWPVRPPGWAPPAALAAFLAAGPPPVVVGFGSMAPGRGGRLAGPVLAAVRAAGLRAVVQAGWAGLRADAGDDVLGVGDVPHDWLFPRAAAVVHHAGAGTTAAGLRAGVPAVAVPVLADQPFWADRLHRLGAAPGPVPLAGLRAARLAAALRAATGDPGYAAAARAVAGRLRGEDGAGRVLTWLAALADGVSARRSG